MAVPGFGDTKVNTGLPPKLTTSVPTTPAKLGVPLALATVVPL